MSAPPKLKRCQACNGQGYHHCECWPCDCLCGMDYEPCEECDGTGIIDPLSDWPDDDYSDPPLDPRLRMG